MNRLVVVGEAFFILQFLSGGPTGRGWVASGISRASTGERGGGSGREIVFWWFGREGRVAAGWDCYMGISKAMEL